ncbi:hypothetical protein LTR15_006099 [Elasticomyces elasticus]|nr:hypothetical protein LTR15_006099 [Elasticomyces elasticus]
MSLLSCAETAMSDLRLQFHDIDSLYVELKNLPMKSQASPHDCLDELARDWDVPGRALQLAKLLAAGPKKDLVVLLLEPTDIHSKLDPFEVFEASPALQSVDEALRFSTGGRRNWLDTCILDIRPFRSASIRQKGSVDSDKSDEKAYACCVAMLKCIDPRVILIAQCQTAGVKNTTAKLLNSSLFSAGKLRALHYEGLSCVTVNSFHPSMFKEEYLDEHAKAYGLDEHQAWTRECLLRAAFDVTFLVAVYALDGRKVHREDVAQLLRTLKLYSFGKGSCLQHEGLELPEEPKPASADYVSDALKAVFLANRDIQIRMERPRAKKAELNRLLSNYAANPTT